jgi:rhodanese-related sulfurtransferase
MNLSPTQEARSIAPLELQQRILTNQPGDLLDVRTAPEYTAAHVPNVTLVPLDSLNPAEFLANRPHPTAPLYVFCQAGGRAAKAIDRFQASGFDGCVLVEGGTQAWIDAGLPVTRGTSKVLPLMRQVQIVIGAVSGVGAALALAGDKRFALIPLITGAGLLFAGLTGTCGLALLLAKMPWNRGDVSKKSVPSAKSGASCCS